MSRRTPFSELLKQSSDDLRREIRAQSMTVRKLQLGIALSKEKDTAQYRRERKVLARMQTALTQKSREQLKQAKKSDTVSAPAAASPSASLRVKKAAPKS